MQSAHIKVSLVVAFYRQDSFVAEVLDGCWAQDYENLEIVISDDASPDDTWGEIQRYVATHPTRHEVVLNRHNENVGMMANYNWLYRRATGRLIVQNDGDDISFPWRCSSIAAAYEAACGQGAHVSIICSHYTLFEGCVPALPVRPTDEVPWKVYDYKSDLSHFNPWECLLGAAMAFPKELLDIFGDLDDKMLEEDIPYTFRSKLVGVRLAIYRPLLYYRVIGGAKKTKSRVFAERVLRCSKQLLKDLNHVRDQVAPELYNQCEAYLSERIRVEEVLFRYSQSSWFVKPFYLAQFCLLRPPVREAYVGVLCPEWLVRVAYFVKRSPFVCKGIAMWNRSSEVGRAS